MGKTRHTGTTERENRKSWCGSLRKRVTTVNVLGARCMREDTVSDRESLIKTDEEREHRERKTQDRNKTAGFNASFLCLFNIPNHFYEHSI